MNNIVYIFIISLIFYYYNNYFSYLPWRTKFLKLIKDDISFNTKNCSGK